MLNFQMAIFWTFKTFLRLIFGSLEPENLSLMSELMQSCPKKTLKLTCTLRINDIMSTPCHVKWKQFFKQSPIFNRKIHQKSSVDLTVSDEYYQNGDFQNLLDCKKVIILMILMIVTIFIVSIFFKFLVDLYSYQSHSIRINEMMRIPCQVKCFLVLNKIFKGHQMTYHGPLFYQMYSLSFCLNIPAKKFK